MKLEDFQKAQDISNQIEDLEELQSALVAAIELAFGAIRHRKVKPSDFMNDLEQEVCQLCTAYFIPQIEEKKAEFNKI